MGITSNRSGYREGSEFSQTVDEFLDAYWQHDPIEATRAGIHLYDEQLPRYGPEAAADWGNTIAEFTERFEAFDSEKLTHDEALDRRWALAVLERQRIDHELRYWERAPQHYLQRVIEWSSWFLRIRSQRLLNRQIRSQSSRSLRVEPQLIGEKYMNSFNKYPL